MLFNVKYGKKLYRIQTISAGCTGSGLAPEYKTGGKKVRITPRIC